jgi:membrane dipeptidase
MRRGGVGLCVATQIARYVAPDNTLPGWHSQEQAWAHTQGQLAWYRAMEERGELVQVSDRAGLDAHLAAWERGGAATPIGYVLSLEGADSIVTIRHLERAHAQGLRAVGPAHYGPGVYAQGTNACGGMGPRGRELLAEMERLGIILDVTHLCDESFRDALDHFRGPVWASHSNCRTLVPHNRQFSDDQIRELIQRDAVIGAVFDAWMLTPRWVRGESTPGGAGVTLATVVDHIDHICQLAGNSRHCMIGSDLDGAFGREQCPSDVQSIADLARLPAVLTARGYTDDDVRNIAHGNFLRFVKRAWD